MCRACGMTPSERMGVQDEINAAALDTAYAVRMLQFDNEVRKQQARLIAQAVWGGSSEETTSRPSKP